MHSRLLIKNGKGQRTYLGGKIGGILFSGREMRKEPAHVFPTMPLASANLHHRTVII